ncbi:uncharacterized protein PRCAT00002106001 [Priceomyces carsonii]|uniref:uncharacterized protein n=1 Tax=Priceomyces carsonii TaxID=28549 RepID=UPI002EDA7473|nr:unnamed protein product [Priceomyces carsonii]
MANTTKKVIKRSRNGCITCKRLKKKCDETKPECLSCQKHNRKCEGKLKSNNML